MFLVSDGRTNRKRMIAKYAADDIAVGVVLAALDFEWTCRRCILALGSEPTMEMKKDFVDQKWFGKELKSAWEEKVRGRVSGMTLPDVFNVWAKENHPCYVAWQDIDHAFDLRNRLVHGAAGTVSVKDGRTCINVFEIANDILCEFVIKEGGLDERSIFKRIVRYGTRNGTVVKQREEVKDFAGTDKGELMLEGVRVNESTLAELTKGRVKASLAKKLLEALRPMFKEW